MAVLDAISPEKRTFSISLEEDMEQIVVSHNLNPRKILGGLSPIEVLAKEQGKHIIFLFNQSVHLHM